MTLFFFLTFNPIVCRILINLKRCRLQIEIFKKLIFINKNWPNDPIIGCKSPSNLLEFLERNDVAEM
jgi:hypothetical protein